MRTDFESVTVDRLVTYPHQGINRFVLRMFQHSDRHPFPKRLTNSIINWFYSYLNLFKTTQAYLTFSCQNSLILVHQSRQRLHLFL